MLHDHNRLLGNDQLLQSHRAAMLMHRHVNQSTPCMRASAALYIVQSLCIDCQLHVNSYACPKHEQLQSKNSMVGQHA